MTFGKLKRDIKKLSKIVKLPDGNYSKEDDEFIKNIIIRFREFMTYLSSANQSEFEKSAKKYNSNLNDLIATIERFIPIIQTEYNKKQFKSIKKRGSTWDKMR